MWDERRRKAHNTEWGKLFAQETKHVLDDVQKGVQDALSMWLEAERKRILPDAECLFLPQIEFWELLRVER